MSDDPSNDKPDSVSLHERLSALCTDFHALQEGILLDSGEIGASDLEQLAGRLVALCETQLDQVLGELFLSEHSNYNFTKPLYVAASLIELIRRHDAYSNADTDDDKRLQMVIGAMGYNLGLLAYEKQVYESQEQFSQEEKRQLREHYPQQSAEILKGIGIDQSVVQDIVRNHNVASDNPSPEAMMMRTPFIYAGIAMPQQLGELQHTIDNPSREFAKMYTNQELDPVFGGLYLKINGLAPIGSIINLESHEKVMVVHGPAADSIGSSTVRMLANHNGVQLKRPGERYLLNQTPTRHRGLADHHRFAWAHFSPHVMWEE